MKVKTNNLDRNKHVRMIYWLLIVFFMGAALFFGRHSFVQMGLKKSEVAKMQEKVNLLKAANDSLRKENHQLRTKPAVIEKIARENLGYQKEGEKVYRFIPPEEKPDPKKN